MMKITRNATCEHSHIDSCCFNAHKHNRICYIVPPQLSEGIRNYQLQRLPDNQARELIDTYNISDNQFRNQRALIHSQLNNPEGQESLSIFGTKKKTAVSFPIFNAHHSMELPGTKFLFNLPDEAGKTALKNAKKVYQYYLQQHHYNSIDGKGMDIISSVHVGRKYQNAFWNGQQMAYGDGDEIIGPFVTHLDVVGHEMTHGVIGNRLNYERESGALNESIADVFGFLVKNKSEPVPYAETDWTMANGILRWKDPDDPDGKVQSFPLRRFDKPGTAFDIPGVAKDTQLSRYSELYEGNEDNGGVHINSGIPNHAFYLFSENLHTKGIVTPFETIEKIWFATTINLTLKDANSNMKEFATKTISWANKLNNNDTIIEGALRSAWKETEVLL